MSNQIRDRIIEATQQRQVAALSSGHKKPKKYSVVTTLLGMTILVISVVTFWVMINKSTALGGTEVSSKNDVSQNPIVKPVPVSQNEFSAFKQDVDSRLETLEKYVTVWSHRTWILGVAHNENTNLTKKVQQAQRVPDPGYIVFDERWKANRLPKTMTLSEKQKQDFQK